jgi:hypothetical protein
MDPAAVNYTRIICSKILRNDNTTLFAGSIETRTATAGSTVSPIRRRIPTRITGDLIKRDEIVPVTVDGDGSTLLNIYYDRETW